MGLPNPKLLQHELALDWLKGVKGRGPKFALSSHKQDGFLECPANATLLSWDWNRRVCVCMHMWVCVHMCGRCGRNLLFPIRRKVEMQRNVLYYWNCLLLCAIQRRSERKGDRLKATMTQGPLFPIYNHTIQWEALIGNLFWKRYIFRAARPPLKLFPRKALSMIHKTLATHWKKLYFTMRVFCAWIPKVTPWSSNFVREKAELAWPG